MANNSACPEIDPGVPPAEKRNRFWKDQNNDTTTLTIVPSLMQHNPQATQNGQAKQLDDQLRPKHSQPEWDGHLTSETPQNTNDTCAVIEDNAVRGDEAFQGNNAYGSGTRVKGNQVHGYGTKQVNTAASASSAFAFLLLCLLLVISLLLCLLLQVMGLAPSVKDSARLSSSSSSYSSPSLMI
ncbi:hypothetical protein HDV62DRAFT_352766 [Trichoderma sp. SZMC 28011]